jgi:hypothetical protein
MNLSNCLKQNNFLIGNDSLYYVTDREILASELDDYKEKKKVVNDSSECTIIENKNYSDTDSGTLVFGYDAVSIFMEQTKRDLLGFTNYTIYLKQVQPLRKILFGLDNLIIN